jgi:hypothetical protein
VAKFQKETVPLPMLLNNDTRGHPLSPVPEQ